MKLDLARSPTLHLPPALLAAVLASGCAAQSGTVQLDISGEEAAEVGYPTGDIAFADGWTLRLDHVLVAVEGVTLADATTSFPVETPSTLVDLTAGEQTVWTLREIPAQRWPEVGYRIAPPTTATLRLGAVTQAQLDALVPERISFRLQGTAAHAMHGSFAIDLAIPMTVTMTRCQSGADGTDGFVVPPSGTHRSQLTAHLDHLFFDSARAEAPSLRFDAWAAAAGDDRVVTLADLETQALADLRGVDGGPLVDDEGALIAYEPPSTGLPRHTLGAFVIAEAHTIGHFEGEGHCDYVAE